MERLIIDGGSNEGKPTVNRTLLSIAAIVTAVMAVVIAFIAAGVLLRVDDRGDASGLVQVAGEGMVLVAPDHATITATAEGRDAESAVALRQADERMERVLAAVRELGIDDDDISTDAVRTQREFVAPTPEGRDEPGDWVATIALRIELDDLELVGKVLAAVNRAGAQQVSGPSYSVRDPDAAYERALDEAMDQARAKADAIASAAGTSIDDVHAVEEARRELPGFERATTAAADASGSAEIDVTPGETEQIRASVTVSYTHD